MAPQKKAAAIREERFVALAHSAMDFLVKSVSILDDSVTWLTAASPTCSFPPLLRTKPSRPLLLHSATTPSLLELARRA